MDFSSHFYGQTKGLISKLNETGILTETELKLSRVQLGKLKNLSSFFRKNGYSGGQLADIGTEIKHEGFMYAIYDTDKLTPKNAVLSLKDFYEQK